ncbi:MAG: ABC transporter ATP-binding protein [Selenomonadaceae bacterium]|nr:ABC transporter ATP-binding protein [Selenomonadaceae bacterium]MBR6888864.1 ABC transporter ATP-binding protein [Selenomonadaceae bacterium]
MIELVNVEKIFGAVRAVDKINFRIERGEVFGLLGKNGAGKTTSIKMLTLQLQPTAGEIFFEGRPTRGNEIFIKSLLGLVPQHLNFDQDLTVEENLELHARLHHLKKIERRERIDELLKFVELERVSKSFVRELSGGMKRRLLIIRALIHRPKILFLDEPTVALDPQVRRKIWDLIKNLKAQGITIVLTTHYIEEAQALCDRVAILNCGQLVALDTTENLCAGKSLEEKFIELTE